MIAQCSTIVLTQISLQETFGAQEIKIYKEIFPW